MRQICVWFLLSCKRYLKKPSFLLILLLLPAVCFFLHGRETQESQQVNVAICVEGAGEAEGAGGAESGTGDLVVAEDLGTALAKALTSDQAEDSLFHFYLCADEKTVQEEVASRRAECGYVISADLRERFESDRGERSIHVYRAPSTVLDQLTDEVVFAELARIYDREIFVNYMESAAGGTGTEGSAAGVTGPGETGTEGSAAGVTGLGGTGAERSAAGSLYDKWMASGATFHFEYHYLDQEESGTPDSGASDDADPEKAALFPVRGLAAVLLFLTGVYSAMVLGMDEEKGLFLRLLPAERAGCRFASAMAPVALAALSCLAAIWAGGSAGGWGREVLLMLLYIPVVTAYGLLLKMVLRDPRLIGCLIPFLLVAALIFCPVFLDVGVYVPQFRMLGRLFPPWYYLAAF